MGRISVIVPVYNRVVVFGCALESIVKQTYRPLQIIVVDDGSSDDVKAVFEMFKEKYSAPDCSFQYIRQENNGAPAARNRGLTEAIGEYVIFWDADTIGKSAMLETMQDMLVKNPDASFVYSNFLLGRKLFRGKVFSHDELKKNNFITTMSLIRTKDVVKWDETLKRFQDWDLWLTMAEQGKKGLWVDEVLFEVKPGGTMSSWLPSFVYKIPFRWLPGFSDKVKKYEKAKDVVVKKHKI